MRASTLVAVLLLSPALLPTVALAQQPETSPGSSEAQTTPVQPERTPQQSDQARARDRQSADDTQVKRDWTTQRRDDDRMGMDRMRQQHMGRMMEDMDHRTTGRNWRMQRDEDDMDRRSHYSDEDRPHRRVKICFEYDNGDELCRYRN
jgi:hypothetical protein